MKRYNMEPTIGLEVMSGGDIRSIESPDGDWVKWNDVSKLEWSHKELLNQLEYMSGQHRCGCGHPHCNRCEDDRMNQEIINKVKETK